MYIVCTPGDATNVCTRFGLYMCLTGAKIQPGSQYQDQSDMKVFLKKYPIMGHSSPQFVAFQTRATFSCFFFPETLSPWLLPSQNCCICKHTLIYSNSISVVQIGRIRYLCSHAWAGVLRNFTESTMRWCSMRPRCSIFPLSGGLGGPQIFRVLKLFHIIPLSFPMHSHHVPKEFPTCFPNSQWVLQDVFNSTSLLSHINLCPKLSFRNLLRQAKEGTAIFLPWE